MKHKTLNQGIFFLHASLAQGAGTISLTLFEIIQESRHNFSDGWLLNQHVGNGLGHDGVNPSGKVYVGGLDNLLLGSGRRRQSIDATLLSKLPQRLNVRT